MNLEQFIIKQARGRTTASISSIRESALPTVRSPSVGRTTVTTPRIQVTPKGPKKGLVSRLARGSGRAAIGSAKLAGKGIVGSAKLTSQGIKSIPKGVRWYKGLGSKGKAATGIAAALGMYGAGRAAQDIAAKLPKSKSQYDLGYSPYYGQ